MSLLGLGMPWDALGCLGMPWDALGCLGMPWDALGCLGMPWDCFVSTTGVPLPNSWRYTLNMKSCMKIYNKTFDHS